MVVSGRSANVSIHPCSRNVQARLCQKWSVQPWLDGELSSTTHPSSQWSGVDPNSHHCHDHSPNEVSTNLPLKFVFNLHCSHDDPPWPSSSTHSSCQNNSTGAQHDCQSSPVRLNYAKHERSRTGCPLAGRVIGAQVTRQIKSVWTRAVANSYIKTLFFTLLICNFHYSVE